MTMSYYTSSLTPATSDVAARPSVASPPAADLFARPQSLPSSSNISPLSQSCCQIYSTSYKIAIAVPDSTQCTVLQIMLKSKAKASELNFPVDKFLQLS